MPLTLHGYVKHSPEELQQILIDKLMQKVPSWQKSSADIQSNLLDAIIPGLLEYENIAAEMCNCYTPDYANDYFWNIFAENLNLKRRAKFKSQVVLLFTGNQGLIIPKGLEISDGSGNTFTIEETAVIPTTGQVYLTGYSEAEVSVPANTLTEINVILDESIKVTNPNASLAALAEDTTALLKSKVQAKLRSARHGSVASAYANLLEVEGVDSRLIKFEFVDYNIKFTENQHDVFRSVRGLEFTIGGGDVNEVALALFKSFLETKKLIAEPSNNETDRIASCELTYYNTPVTIQWIIPKEMALQINVLAGFTGISLTSAALTLALQETLTNYINTKQVGTPLSRRQLDSIVYQVLEGYSIRPESIFELDYEVYLGAKQVNFDTRGFLEGVEKDCYLTLEGFTTTIVQNTSSQG